MSELKKFTLMIIFITFAILLGMTNKVSATSRSTDNLNNGSSISLAYSDLTAYDNLYCVAHGKSLKGGAKRYIVRHWIEIQGNKIVNSDKGAITDDNENNGTLAAILGGPLTKGYGTKNNYGPAQKALYGIWNTWVKSVGSNYGFVAYAGNDRVNGTSGYVNQAKAAAQEKDYHVIIYYLSCGSESWQQLILVDVKEPDNPTPGHVEEKGNVNISGYVWEDVANSKNNTINSKYEEGDLRVSGIKVHWKAPDGSEIASTTTDNNGSYKMSTQITLYDHSYAIEKAEYDRLNNSYIEFEYNGLKYTTVAYNGNLAQSDTSKGKENGTQRTALDNKFDKVENRTVYDGNSAIISGLPNTQISDANYNADLAVSASTKDIARALLNAAETNKWTQTKEFCGNHVNGSCLSKTQGIYEWNINNMNLGLARREQPDAAISSDIEKVRVIMKNEEYTYEYGNRGIQNNEELFDYTVKFGNKYMQTYTRPVNPADIAYVNYNNTDDLKVYVTYDIILKNQSNTLPMTINSITNYYENDYSIYTGNGTSTSSGWQEVSGDNNGFKIASNAVNITIKPGEQSDIIKLEFEVSQSKIKELQNQDEGFTFTNYTEISSYSTKYGENTICAERETAATKGKTNQQYAGIDTDSTPGNLVPGQENTYEDDTDRAPSFLLKKDPNYKTLSGIVYEDTQTAESKKDNERLGNGKKDNNEKGVQKVKVELLNPETNETAYLYYKDANGANRKPAITYSDSNGNYSFGDGTTCGVVEDNYIIKYTYGNSDDLKTTIDGGEPYVNARNYKSTIITDSNIKSLMTGESNNDKWYLNMDENLDTSIAIDDMDERLKQDTLKNSTYNNGENMLAYSKKFAVQLEYTNGQSSKVDNNGGDFKHDLSVFDFGIIERPREDVVINKTISKVKLTLANGQVLLEGDPRKDKLNYVKALGLEERQNAKFNAMDAAKALSIEMDQELIQGSTLELWYSIMLTNNSEKDYDYEVNSNYYYYGTNKQGDPLALADLVVDYMNSTMVCNVGDDFKEDSEIVNNKDWYRYDNGTATDAEYLKNNGYISYKLSDTDVDKTYETLKNRNMQSIVTNTFAGVKPGETKNSVIYASKVLSNQNDNHLYDNHVEIIALNGKTGRTIKGAEETTRKQIEKEYQPGNYIPNLSALVHQQDDDNVRVTITPPTGTTNYTTIYIISAVVGLIVISGGIVLIKRKFENK